MSKENFEELVKKAILALPKPIREKMDNVAIVIEDRSSLRDLRKTSKKKRTSLLGLYQGVPKTTWGRGFSFKLPDKITIFQEPIEKLCSSPQEIKQLVLQVVWHEIAHHFGFSEKRVRALEPKWRNRKI